jgi:hypothetical protein
MRAGASHVRISRKIHRTAGHAPGRADLRAALRSNRFLPSGVLLQTWNIFRRGSMNRLPLCSTACAAGLIGVVLWSQPSSTAMAQIRGSARDSVVEGVFEGRTPCARIANEFTGFPAAACEKIKWELTLYRDAATREPRSYRYRGTRTAHNGAWTVTRGAATNPDAVVYELRYGGGVLRLLAADENVLLLMDSDRRLMVGDASWSYTFNRTHRN